jgi:MORN repeat
VLISTRTTAESDTSGKTEAVQSKRATLKVAVVNFNSRTASELTQLLSDTGNSNGSTDTTNKHAETKLTPPEATLAIDSDTATLIRSLKRQHSAPVQLVISGEIAYADATVYDGYIQAQISSSGTVLTAMPYGFGTTTEPDGSTYTGFYENSKCDGFGTYTEKHDDVKVQFYKGFWAHNQKHGNGEETTDDGSTYEGTWYNSKRHGDFKLYDTNGEYCQSSTWHNGECV